MPRAERKPNQVYEEGGGSGNPDDQELSGSGMNGGPRQPLPPLARQEVQRTFQQERQERVDAVPLPRKYRVTKVPRNQDGMVQLVVGRGGRQFKINEGKELDERYFDIPSIRRQGVKLEEIDQAAEAAEAAG
jgi:hypothetical protein